MMNNNLIKSFREEEKRLASIIHDLEGKLAKAPEGSVKVKKHGKGMQFYHRTSPDSTNGVYIPVANRELAVSLIEKRYHKRLLAAARKQLDAIHRFLKNYDVNALKDVYAGEAAERQKILLSGMLTKELLPDQEYAKIWQAESYQGKAFHENAAVHYTQKHEQVRSKSEVLIANILFQKKIPYHYEHPLQLGSTTIHPDFTVLRVSDRTSLYWEHLGMMDDNEYRNHALQRIRLYEKHGILPGDRLILTMETFKMPLNAVTVENAIRAYQIDV